MLGGGSPADMPGRRTNSFSLGNTLRSALPLAVQWSGKLSPIAETARRRWRPWTWSVNTAEFPLSTDRSTVSPTVCDSSTMMGRVMWSNSTLADAASRMSAGPRRTPAVGEAEITNCSARSASTIRCTVERARLTRCAIWPRLRPSGSPSSARSTLMARVMTWILCFGESFVRDGARPAGFFAMRSSFRDCCSMLRGESIMLKFPRAAVP